MAIEAETVVEPFIKSQSVEGRMTGALAFAIFSVTLGSFQFGYHIGCVNAPGEVNVFAVPLSHLLQFFL
ncbi:hypothetical protein Y032_0344g3088 [Ancylostoma ceylanicum]|uniref:Major facilitator superfamily (MFS) profile domain-containing protein n=1 Tax=Ancylostoma ceylanicum TaxID=53326 RepID=A0A016RXK9_9BILA|nr:hypothetical protein Y032_0344g3088 [Ancylostoma ceylanicum]